MVSGLQLRLFTLELSTTKFLKHEEGLTDMRIVFDLDGVICELKKPSESYGEVKPKLDVIKLVNELHSNGDHIIIHTGRHMRTCNGNVDEVIKKVGKITKDWLKKNNVKYDELIFGKPHADMYIDDLGLSFDSSDKLKEKMDGIKLNFIIPMGGEGKRFKNSKFNKPKFMIETKNKTLLEWAIQSLPLDFAHKIFFIIRKNDEQNFRVKEFIKKIMKEKFSNIKFEILLLSKNTRGQAETVLNCKKYINNDRGLLIFNNDTYFKSTRLKSRLLSMKNQNIDGILGIFNSNNPEYSFVKIDNENKVIKTKEKKVISNFASTGMYIFSKGSDFIKSVEYAIEEEILSKNEFYISELYNILIKEGKKFTVDIADEFVTLGTPEDIKKFEA
jgi:capsule biosynthesis phosphatase